MLKKEGERVLKAVEGFDIVSVLAVEAAVSYTHLDVYKRQVLELGENQLW